MSLYFDIGANKGDYTQYILGLGDNKVICVEANPRQATNLSNRYKNQNVVVVNKAVSMQPRPIPFYICPDCDVISTADIEWKNNSRFANDVNRQWWEIMIDTISIDELIKKYGVPTHIKLDVEGYEYNALQSMTKNYTQIRFEWAEEKSDELILSLEYLIKLGYTTFGVIAGDTYHMTPDEFMNGEDMIEFIQGKVDSTRKELWGMMFALNEGDEYIC